MAKLAILLYDEAPEREQVLLARMLDFFGVPWKMLPLSEFPIDDAVAKDSVVFGSAADVSRALKQAHARGCRSEDHVAFYVYAEPDRTATDRGLRSLLRNDRVSLGNAPETTATVRVSAPPDGPLGPMAGIETRSPMRADDAVVLGLEGEEHRFDTFISADGLAVYARFWDAKVPIYFCASSYIVDIDDEVEAGFYDVKRHFCSTVPLVSFIQFMFQEVAWQPQELGACLIIDDPLLKERYGACDFRLLRKLMQLHGFTTNIAFIPWNWWRTSRVASELFENGTGKYSISIHGCDHIESEFGDSSSIVLSSRAKLAQTRMKQHEARTGIHHDPIMVFPQGVFSSRCPVILKRTGFWAAVNTEVSPVDSSGGRTRIRDVWNIATMKYGDFPVFTRRYAHHGIENIAFDLLLGKPCLIVAHHEFFKDGCAALLRLLEELQAMSCSLHWQSLGAVVRRACRRRSTGGGTEEVQMCGTELCLRNLDEQPVQVLIVRQEGDPEAIAGIQCDGAPIPWRFAEGRCSFEANLPPRSECHFRISYRALDQFNAHKQSAVFRSSVATRRVLSELRDASIGKFASISLAAAQLMRTGK